MHISVTAIQGDSKCYAALRTILDFPIIVDTKFIDFMVDGYQVFFSYLALLVLSLLEAYSPIFGDNFSFISR